MSFGSRPTSSPPFRPRPSGRADERSAFAVGSRALVTPTPVGAKSVQLLDEDGLPTNANLAVDVGVVITAWRPRRMATPRYRVRSTDGVEGWVDATNLRRLPPPPPPTPIAVPVAAPKTAPKAAPVRPPARKPSPSAVPARAQAKPAPKEAAKPAPKLPVKPAAKLAVRPAPKAAAKPAPKVAAAKAARPAKRVTAKKKPAPPARKRAR